MLIFPIFLSTPAYIMYLVDVLSVALLVVLTAKCEAINPFIEYLKLLLVLVERLYLEYLTVLTDEAKECYYSPFMARPHRFLPFS
jgi:hypothetical protein